MRILLHGTATKKKVLDKQRCAEYTNIGCLAAVKTVSLTIFEN